MNMQPMAIEGLLAQRFAQPNIQVPVNTFVPTDNPAPLGGGVWGEGGRLITPEQAQQQRARAQELMGIDYSPIGSPWQGLARVIGNVQGAFQERGVRRAEDRTAEHNRKLMEQLSSGSSGGSGVSSPASGPNIEALLLDKYASPEVRAVAQRRLDMAEFDRRKQMEAQVKRQETVFEDNAGNRWRMGENGLPEEQPIFVDRTPRFDSQVVTDPTTGQQVLMRVPIQNPYAVQPSGAQSSGPAVGAVVADPRKAAAGNVDSGLASMDSSKTITRADLRAVQASLGPNGRAASEKWMRENNIKVVD